MCLQKPSPVRQYPSMSKQQIQKRVCPEAISRTLRQWNDRKITTAAAMQMLDVSRLQLYRLRTAWFSSGKKRAVAPGVSGGDHAADWPKDCVDPLATMLEASGDHGPDYVLYADELERLFGFRRDRANVRKYCEVHMEKLLRKLFSVDRWAPVAEVELRRAGAARLHPASPVGMRRRPAVGHHDG